MFPILNPPPSPYHTIPYHTIFFKFLKVVKDNRQSNVTYYIAYGNRICLLLIYVASAPITSRQIGEEKVETVTEFIFLGSKITADEKKKNHCRW